MAFPSFSAMRKDMPSNGPSCFKMQDEIQNFVLFKVLFEKWTRAAGIAC